MNDYVNKHLKATLEFDCSGSYRFQKVRPRIVCADGVGLSVQAGEYMYSTPRRDEANHYVCVEVGFPDIIPPIAWREYAEDWSEGFIGDLRNFFYHVRVALRIGSRFSLRLAWRRLIRGRAQNTVYAYIPIVLVNQFIEDHGGVFTND